MTISVAVRVHVADQAGSAGVEEDGAGSTSSSAREREGGVPGSEHQREVINLFFLGKPIEIFCFDFESTKYTGGRVVNSNL